MARKFKIKLIGHLLRLTENHFIILKIEQIKESSIYTASTLATILLSNQIEDEKKHCLIKSYQLINENEARDHVTFFATPVN